jgi:hypothetical protein
MLYHGRIFMLNIKIDKYPCNLTHAKETHMGRPLNKKYFGPTVPGGTQLACQAWVPGDDQARSGYIIKQDGNSRYLVSTPGGQGECYLSNDIDGPEQMVVQVVTPNGTLSARKINDRDLYTWDGGFWTNWTPIGGQAVYGTTTTSSYWVAAYGDEGRYSGADGCSFDSQGNLIVIGEVDIDGVSYDVGSIVKLDSVGNKIWEKQFTTSSSGSWQGEVVLCDNNDNIYAGFYDSDANLVTMIKLNSSGVIQWQTNLNGYRINDIALDKVTGVSALSYRDNVEYRYNVAKFNADGTVAWQKRFNNAEYNFYYIGLQFTPDGKLACSARYFNNSNFQNGIAVWTLTSAGDLVWAKGLEEGVTQQSDTSYGVIVDTDAAGNIYAQVPYDSDGSEGAIYVKYNSAGDLQWQVAIDDPTDNFAPSSIIVDPAGNLYANGDGPEGLIYLKLDTNGNLLWNTELYTTGGMWPRHNYGSQDLSLYGDALAGTGSVYYAWWNSDGPEGDFQLITKLPTDGSRLGVRGLYTYIEGPLVATTSTFTESTPNVFPQNNDVAVTSGDWTTNNAEINISVTYFD